MRGWACCYDWLGNLVLWGVFGSECGSGQPADVLSMSLRSLPRSRESQCLCARVPALQPLDTGMLLEIFQQSAAGLYHLHQQGIIHRDFRCDNILVSSIQPISVRVSDFGLSHQLTAETKSETTGTVLGPIRTCFLYRAVPCTVGARAAAACVPSCGVVAGCVTSWVLNGWLITATSCL